MSINVFCGVGCLTKDITLHRTNGAEPLAVAKFTLAINRKDGADFISCVAFGKTAETMQKYCGKGSKVGIVGHIQTGSYTKQDGTKVYTTDVIVDRLDLCGSAEQKAELKPDPTQQTMDDFIPAFEGVPFI